MCSRDIPFNELMEYTQTMENEDNWSVNISVHTNTEWEYLICVS